MNQIKCNCHFLYYTHFSCAVSLCGQWSPCVYAQTFLSLQEKMALQIMLLLHDFLGTCKGNTCSLQIRRMQTEQRKYPPVQSLLGLFTGTWWLIGSCTTEKPQLPAHQATVLFLIFKMYLFFKFCVSVCEYVHICIQLSVGSRRGYRITWSWSSRWLWAIWYGCWELNLDPARAVCS